MQFVNEAAPVIPRDRLLDLHGVTAIAGVQKSTIYNFLRDPKSDFPKPIRLGSKCVRWSENQVLSWVQSRIQGTQQNDAAVGV